MEFNALDGQNITGEACEGSHMVRNWGRNLDWATLGNKSQRWDNQSKGGHWKANVTIIPAPEAYCRRKKCIHQVWLLESLAKGISYNSSLLDWDSFW